MNVTSWFNAFTDALSNFLLQVVNHLPNILATLLIVLVGWLVSKLVTKWLAKILEKVGFNKVSEGIGLTNLLQKLGFQQTPSALCGNLVHIFIILGILVAAASSLGFDSISNVFDEFILYVPKVVGALIITLLGLFIANTAKNQLTETLNNLGVEYSSTAARLAQLIILFVTFSLAISQLQIETGLLNTVFAVVLGCAGFAIALALGFGSKDIASNMVSGIYAREQLLPGDEIEIDGFSGNIVAITNVTTIIENKKGQRLSVPNSSLINGQYKYKPLS